MTRAAKDPGMPTLRRHNRRAKVTKPPKPEPANRRTLRPRGTSSPCSRSNNRVIDSSVSHEKADWRRLVEQQIAWACFFDALKVEASEAFNRLLGIATFGGAWLASYFSDFGGVKPDRVHVYGLVHDSELVPGCQLFFREVPPRCGWGVTFFGHEEQAATFEDVTKRVILWELQYHLIDTLGRPHPRAFACAMNVIGAEKGDLRAGWELSAPTTLPRQLTLVSTDPGCFEAVLNEPPFDPSGGESRRAFYDRIHKALNPHVHAYLRHFEESGKIESKMFPKRVLHHFNWLVRNLVCLESAGAIAMTLGRKSGLSTVQEAIESTAKLLRLRPGPRKKIGRPRKPPDRAERT